MATDLERLVIRLEAQMKSYEREWEKARNLTDRQTRAIEQRVEGMTSRLGAMMQGWAAGFAGGVVRQLAVGLGAIFTGGEFLQNTIESEKAVAQLEAALKATGNVVGFTSKQLQDMASNIQKVTTFGDEAVMTAQTMLLRFTRIGHDVFPEAIKASTNLSAALGQDLTSSAQMIGRALDDPIQGVTRLRRAGVQFTEAQKEQIKTLVQSGRGLEAQKLILDEVTKRYGGAAEAARNTLGGALTSLKNAFGDMFEVQNSDELKRSIENVISVLQSPDTMSSIQNFGSALFDAFALGIKGATALALAVGGTIGIMKSMLAEIGTLVSGGNIQDLSTQNLETLERLTRPNKLTGTGLDVTADARNRQNAEYRAELERRKKEGEPLPRLTVRPGMAPDFNTGKQRDDALDKEEDKINKRIELLNAEVATLGMNTQARQEAKAEAELWSAALKAGIPITDEVLIRISYLAQKWGEAAGAAETAKLKFKELNDSAKDFTSGVSEAFKGLILQGKSLNEVLTQLLNRLASRAIDKLIESLLLGPTGNLTSGSGLLGALISGARAEGGPVGAGKTYLVGERGPELVRFGQSGMVIPNKAIASSGGGRSAINVRVFNSAPVQPKVQQNSDGGIDVFIPPLEDAFAGRAARGQGALVKTLSARQSGRQLRG